MVVKVIKVRSALARVDLVTEIFLKNWICKAWRNKAYVNVKRALELPCLLFG